MRKYGRPSRTSSRLRRRSRKMTPIVTLTLIVVIVVSVVLILTGVIPLFRTAQTNEGVPTPSPVTAMVTPQPRQTGGAEKGEAVAQIASPTPLPTPSPTPAPTPSVVDTSMEWPEAMPFLEGNSLYELEVDADAREHTLQCRMRLTYVNPTFIGLNELYLYLYPNAFQTLPDGLETAEKAVYPGGFDPGFLNLQTVALDGTKVAYQTDNNGELLHIPLSVTLEPGESCQVYLECTVRVPNMNNRFGWNKEGMYLGNCFPIMAAHNEDGSWKLAPYVHRGDPFCSDLADYRVAFTADPALTLASTGEEITKQERDGRVTSYLSAVNVREFACVLLNGMQRTDMETGTVAVTAYADRQHVSRAFAQHAASAIDLYSQYIGNYPYASLTVVECNLGGSLGMEYPGLLLISNRSNEQELAMTVAHETCHQWFYGVVGSDGYNEPWVDEALVQFLGIWYLKYAYGEDAFLTQVDMRSDMRTAVGHYLNENLEEIGDNSLYGPLIYVRGCYLYNMLYNQLGEDTFFQAIRDYYNQHAFSIAVGTDIQKAFEPYLGANTTLNLFRGVFMGPQAGV